MMGKAKSSRMIVLLATTILTAVGGNGVAHRVAFAQTAQVYRFNIPAKPIRQAMNDIVSVSGIDVVFSETSAASAVGKPVSGTLTPSQAVAALLSGTGLSYRFTSSNTVTIFDARRISADGGVADDGSTMLQEIVIQGQGNPNSTIGNLPEEYAGGQVATGGQVGMLGNRDTMNTPFSQTSYTNRKIQDQQAQTVQDVLSNDPSILTNTQTAGNNDEITTIRGFIDTGVNGSKSLNGLVGMAPLHSPDTDYLERVEVLRGPGALLNGMSASGLGGIGGSVNLFTKQASDEPLTQITTRYDSRSQIGAHIDVGRRFGAEKQFGVRFNGAFRKGDTPLDTQSTEIGSAALNLDYRGERVRISADFVHQSNEASPANSQLINIARVAGLGVVPRAPDGDTNFMPPWSEHKVKTTLGMIRGEVDITENVTAYAAIGMQRNDYYLFSPNVPQLLDMDGQYSQSGHTQAEYIRDVLSMQGGVRATFNTGLVDHALSLNVSQAGMEWKRALFTAPYACTTSIYDPVFCPAPAFRDLGETVRSSKTRMSSIAIADTMSMFDDRLQFTAGLRYQDVKSDVFNRITGELTTSYENDAWTPAFGLVVKPWENASLYANYMQDLQVGEVVQPPYVNAGEVFPPFVSEQYEAGVKVDWGNVITTLSAFQITRANYYGYVDASGALVRALDGEQRNRGIELNAYGEISPGVRLLGGLTLLDARQTRTANGTNDGKRANGAPAFRAVVGAEWDTPFMEGLTLTGRVTYTGEQVVNNDNENLKIPDWAIVDIGARYTFNSPWNDQPITVRASIDNVFDKNYWSTAQSNSLYLGAPRTFRLSTTFKF
ncbi:TonB-dependent receptor [Shinella pollutisoli]|uniref:TonB-dependent siderophore receptor n=1 Tax=Shinella pollutisoli TaxID=2250594 RepID=A0ABV7DND4_9HYPH|nr:TonB-dependent receptor [Shinella pollutisoli]